MERDSSERASTAIIERKTAPIDETAAVGSTSPRKPREAAVKANRAIKSATNRKKKAADIIPVSEKLPAPQSFLIATPAEASTSAEYPPLPDLTAILDSNSEPEEFSTPAKEGSRSPIIAPSANGEPPEEPEEPDEPITSTVPKPIQRKKMSSHTSLSLPEASKLKGAENYQQWKDKVINIAKSNGIAKFLHEKSRTKKPQEVDEWDDDVKEEDLKKWQDWETGESQMKLAITLNCKAGPLGHTQGKSTALDMWESLQHQYEGSGTVLEYNAIQTYVSMKYDDYTSLEKFVVAFKLSIAKLDALEIAPPQQWNPVMFIAACSERWPIWAERQRSNLRSATTKAKKAEITLESLIEDITDEARANSSSSIISGQALYGNKSNSANNGNRKKGGGGGGQKSKQQLAADARPDCKHCKQPKPFHPPQDCYVVNKELRDAYEKKNGKPPVPYFKRQAENNGIKKGGGAHNKKKNSGNDDSEDEIFGNPVFPCLDPCSSDRAGGSAFFTSRNKKRWLYDTGASEHVCNDLSKFTTYVARDDLPFISTVGGPVRPLGKGTCTINSLKSNGSVRVLECYNTLYMPQSPVNLYSGLKLNKLGGYQRGNMLLTSSDKEICAVDDKLFILEEASEPSVYVTGHALPAAIEKAPIDIELWHRRMCHAGFQAIRDTQGSVVGMKFKETKTGRTRVCAPCEKGRPVRKTNKKSARPRPTKALQELSEA